MKEGKRNEGLLRINTHKQKPAISVFIDKKEQDDQKGGPAEKV